MWGAEGLCGFVIFQSLNKSANIPSELLSFPFSFLCQHSGVTRGFLVTPAACPVVSPGSAAPELRAGS